NRTANSDRRGYRRSVTAWCRWRPWWYSNRSSRPTCRRNNMLTAPAKAPWTQCARSRNCWTGLYGRSRCGLERLFRQHPPCRLDEVGGSADQRAAQATTGQDVAGDAGRGNGRAWADTTNDPQQGRRPRHATGRRGLTALGESVYAPVHPGLEAVGPRTAAASSYRQLCRRLRDLHAGPGRAAHGRDAGHDDQAEIDGERTEDASMSPAGRHVHVSGVHVRTSVFDSDGTVLPWAETRAEEDPQAVSRDQRTDRSPYVSAGHLGRSTDAQPEVTWLDKLLLSGDASPGLRRGAEACASQATPVAVFEA